MALVGSGLVTSVGFSTQASCAAIRAKLSNPSETRFRDSAGDWIMSHTVELDRPLRGLAKLIQMAAMTAEEALGAVSRDLWPQIPVLLCLAERERQGRVQGLDDEVLTGVCALLGDVRFADDSHAIPQGRVSIGVALLRARQLLYQSKVPAVLILAADSLLCWQTLHSFDQAGRLLNERNSNGFVPGEAASAVLLARSATGPHLSIDGLGFATERVNVDTEAPLRADGLTQAITLALADASRQMHEMDCRLTDISGEQYYFKEAALGVQRTLKQRKQEFDLWHPAESVGEVGSAVGPLLLTVAAEAGRGAYAPGPAMLVHVANDAGQRAALVVHYRV